MVVSGTDEEAEEDVYLGRAHRISNILKPITCLFDGRVWAG